MQEQLVCFHFLSLPSTLPSMLLCIWTGQNWQHYPVILQPLAQANGLLSLRRSGVPLFRASILALARCCLAFALADPLGLLATPAALGMHRG